MRFTLTIETDNAAFCDIHGDDDAQTRDYEVARILRRLAADLNAGGLVQVGLYDVNGNRVGEARYE